MGEGLTVEEGVGTGVEVGVGVGDGSEILNVT